MPFDPQIKVLHGDDAATPASWARITFCIWLATKLNDANGPYAGKLGIRPDRQAFVSENGELAKAKFSDKKAPPVVTLEQGPIADSDYRREIVGVVYEGRRLEIQCTLDMGVGDATPDDDDVAAERNDENNLVGFVTDAISEGYNELGALGLSHALIKPDGEKQGRHPQQLTFLLRTLRDWEPEPEQ